MSKALSDKNLKYKDINIYCILINNYGVSRLNLNEYNDLPKLFYETMKLSDSAKLLNHSFASRNYLSQYYFKIGDTVKSRFFASEALKIAKKSKTPYDILNGLVRISSVDKDKASYCILEYDRIIDSLIKSDRKTRNQFLKIQFETDEITQEKETAIKQKWIIASIAGLLIALGVLLFVIKMQRNKQKELLLVQTQQKANEEIYQLMLQQNATEEKAKQTEKTRIARELHDGILNKLASTRLNLFMLSKNNNKETIDNALKHVSKIQDIESEIRDIAHNLNQDVFRDNTSFTTLLEKLIANQNQISTTTFILEMDSTIQWEQIPGSVKMNFYRIIQEAIHNTNKYAKATKASISIIPDQNNICMSITDNGIGFDLNKEKNGIGIKNMQQRVATLNGKISFDSAINKGTSIYLSVPIM